ncbi:hypothetical protein KZZ07_10510 [Mameliella sp. CS4]|uniref:calcium-binding protein n=1 Tax=Mameliella sp. CS4 TaxID=2862329 RepID=UPI001C601F20|nr:calcium-binding protein [Mameliella sp. CS4]MBW4982973.1 hypothetical protein [Mameliella sp. CS4]
MTIVYQSSSSSSMVTVANGDDLVVREAIDIYVSGTGVTLSSGNSRTGLLNQGDIFGILAVNVNASNTRIVNEGSIHGVTQDAIDLGGGDGKAVIVNTGTITADAHLIDVEEATGTIDLFFNNAGIALADYSVVNAGFVGPNNLGAVYIDNSGLMRGAVIAMNGDSVSHFRNSGTVETNLIDMRSDLNGLFFNSGTITGLRSPDAIVSAALNAGIFGSDNNNFMANSGTIYGVIRGGDGIDRYEAFGNGFVSEGVFGEAGDDTFSGGSQADLLDGGADNDKLVGRGGDDNLIGGSGLDVILGGDGNDSIDAGPDADTAQGNAGDDTILGGTGNDLLLGQDGSDLLDGGSDNDTIDGGAGDDILEGGNGNDILRGRAGEDDLAGGLGRDFLTGGQDADNFVFRALAETVVGANRDQILDFEQGVDLIVVAGLSPGVFEFRGTAGFAPSGNPELRLVETATGSTIVQLDADGDGTQDAEIRVANVTGLTADDFVL